MTAACTVCRLSWEVSVESESPYECPACHKRERRYQGTMQQTIKITRYSGEEIVTRINGTREEILRHYRQNNQFERDRRQWIRSVEFIGDAVVRIA